ncbi:hypothetical protein RF656_04675 [Yersinia kristensenii]|uniref:hypothetical protein n=1 Tax=Yersinia kristensenii TaxID=28152 RepID=UPI002853517C|nr:hypothetical protein [Yersinia kristensenii]MDR4896043.1 hypothetical protein [Yersinia kristensenii]MDX6734684.1 hypothetical protein [Yersinia kristensenii]
MAKIIIEVVDGGRVSVRYRVELSKSNQFENDVANGIANGLAGHVAVKTKQVIESLVKTKRGKNHVH